MIPLAPAHRALARRPRSGNAIRLYWWLCGELDPLEYRPVKIAAVGRALTMHPQHVCRHLATLRRLGFLHRNGRNGPGGAYLYRLIPNPTVPETVTSRAA